MLMLAAQAENMSGSYVTTVVITGVVVVFLGLVLLIAFVFCIGKLFEFIEATKEKKKNQSPVTEQAKPVATPAAPVPTPAIEDGISDEVVAVITAAVAAMSPEFKVADIKKSASKSKSSRRTVWGDRGVNESTSAF